MRRLAPLIACLLALALPAAAVSPALAKGPRPSAGDQQYVDPLTSTSQAAPPATTTLVAARTRRSSKLSKKPPMALNSTTTTSTTITTAAKTSTLPFTGLDIGACIAVGLALLLAGACLRRVTTRLS